MRFFCFYVMVVLVNLLAGCQPKSSNTPSDAPFSLFNQTVILDKTHVMEVQTALYQPSFELQGVVLPNKTLDIKALSDGMAILSPQLGQNPTQKVSQGDVLFTITPAFFEEYTATPIKINAPFDGRLSTIYIKHDTVNQNDTLATFIDNSVYQFVSLLPKEYLPYLSVGQSVSFSPKATANDELLSELKLTGQVANITQTDESELSVTVHLSPSAAKIGMGQAVGGWIDYGQLDVGALVPAYAIADGVNLTTLTTPPYKPSTPLSAHIWIIKQDGTLSLTEIHVVSYQPDTQKYLVTGISQDTLIATANLPKTAQGMAVKIR